MSVSYLFVFVLGIVVVNGKHDNFCRPLEDYGPRYDQMEERLVCETQLEKSCEPIRVSDCMNVTELACEVNLFTRCAMNWTMQDILESEMKVRTVDLKNCTKEMVVEYHNKTVYECRNVTKRHCTTLWTINEIGEKIWTGNEDDCRDVTWEECSPLVKTVPMSVAQMLCDTIPVSYFDYQNITNSKMADTMDCLVEKKAVCTPVTSMKCADITYTKCQELPKLNCSTVSIPVPSQEKLHKQWCLFDQTENIDFDEEVRKITNEEPDVLEAEHNDLDVLSDLRPSETRNIEDNEPIFLDLRTIDTQAQESYGRRKRNNKKKSVHNQSQSKRVTRVSKNISVRH